MSLELRNVTRRYGSISVVDGVSMAVSNGARHALIGPNGAGKSTLFALIAGSIRPNSGSILLDGHDATRWADHRRARAGLGRSFQTCSLFNDFNALENVVLGVQRGQGRGRAPARARELAGHFLEMAGMQDQARRRASELSHGERRQLEVAMALATDARLILLDEPSAGMSPEESDRLVELIHSLPGELTLLLIEHDLKIVFEVATHVSVLDLGRLIFTGDPDSARRSEDVQRAYLGESASQVEILG